MRKTTTLLAALFVGGIGLLQAQTVTVAPATDVIGTDTQKGLQTTLFVDEKFVTKGWRDYIRPYGKVEQPKGSKNVYNVPVAKIPNVGFAPMNLTSRITTASGATTVFYAIRLDTGFVTDPKHPQFATARDLLHSFGVQMYREQVNREIEDAQKELDKRTRTSTQLVKKGENLKGDLEQNRKDKISFESQLVENKADSAQLVRDIAANQERAKKANDDLAKQKTMMTTLKAALDSSGIVYTGKKKKDMPPELITADKELKDKEKEVEKATREGDNLRKAVEKNARQKVELQNKLIRNAADKERIPKEIEANLKEQQNAQAEVQKQQKVVDQVKAKLDQIK
jgi:hypothetical protein